MKLINISIISILIFLLSCSFPSYPTHNKPFICITFDDEHQSAYDNALPILAEFGFSATNFVNSEMLGTGGKYGWEELEEMEFVHGWETGGHTSHHITMTNYDIVDVENEIRTDWQALKEHGLCHESFAIPSGTIAEKHVPIILKYYRNIRSSNDLKLKRPIDRTFLGYYSYDSSFSHNDMIARIIRGVENGEDVIIIGFHKVAYDDEGHSANCPPDEFRRIIEWVYENEFEVITIKEAVQKFTIYIV